MLENLHDEFRIRLNEQTEWLLIRSSGKSFALQNTEIELTLTNDKLLFSFLDDKGFQTWRVTGCEFDGDEAALNLTRDLGRENEKIRLIPRVSAKELSENIELARLEKANKIAQIIKEEFPRTKLVRVELNKENGRFAQVIFENINGSQTAVLADVSDALTPEILISTAILWLASLGNRVKKPIENIWITSEKKQAKNVQKLHAVLRQNWKRKIHIKEISRPNAKAQKEKQQKKDNLKDLASLEIANLWREKAKEIKAFENFQISRSAQEIVELAPDKIDVVFSGNGETLRFLGLPFARVREALGKEKIWFGIEKKRTVLAEDNYKELLELIENLRIYRRFDSPNKQHVFYAQAPEAWLEAILRRNIKLLDANLILSPVYHQFRAEKDKIDLLALRRDGRLVIIEIKISPDREMIFQAAAYWRKIELQRRKGNLQKARVFGDSEISDKPAIIYLVAPTLSFHKNFKFLASAISPEIEIHRFNLAENWRENLKVLERKGI